MARPRVPPTRAPRELHHARDAEDPDAATADGCADPRTLLKVVPPATGPGIAAVALLQFRYAQKAFVEGGTLTGVKG
ncbi:hypothetical protein ABZY20_18075 [Streptomyces sp. NPDC006624]|uniref:hypothetical protein n=1 Tax=Streptomyces sp. NPDC006624 TaxID=3154892 RepID=UPI0033B05832